MIRRASVASGVEHHCRMRRKRLIRPTKTCKFKMLKYILRPDGLFCVCFCLKTGYCPKLLQSWFGVKFPCRIGCQYFGRRTGIRITLKRKVTFY